jgi:hypothetical protein
MQRFAQQGQMGMGSMSAGMMSSAGGAPGKVAGGEGKGVFWKTRICNK